MLLEIPLVPKPGICEDFYIIDCNKWFMIIWHFRTMLTRQVFASNVNSAMGVSPG